MIRRRYYQIAASAGLENIGHPAFRFLRRLAWAGGRVLDVGCGEGTRLHVLVGDKADGVGVDIDAYALKLARTQYPQHQFRQYDGRKLPFTAGEFDLVYCAFVIEHVSRAEELVAQMTRVLKRDGYLAIWAPNYGAPNRRSPNSTANPYSKFTAGLGADLFPAPGLNWTQVVPKKVYRKIDDDTVVEPYVLSLGRYLRGLGLRVVRTSSLWETEPWLANPRKLALKLMGRLGIWPVKYWGPQLFVVAQKP